MSYGLRIPSLQFRLPRMQAKTNLAAKARRPLYDTVYDSLRERLMDGRFRAGEILSEVQLSEMLSVSRTPVRDAVRRLVAEKLLEVSANGAVRVYFPTAVDLADVYCTRATLEGMAARLAAMHVEDDFINRLVALCDRCDALSQESDAVLEAAALNGEFHRAIYERAGNARIKDLLSNLSPVIVRYRHISLAYPEHLKQSWQEHRTIVRLFSESGPDTVETHVRNHILRAGGRIVKAMRAMEGDFSSTPAVDLVLGA